MTQLVEQWTFVGLGPGRDLKVMRLTPNMGISAE